MADESDLEKTEPASPRRLDKAREEGQVPRSRELVTFLMLAGGVAGLWLGGDALSRALGAIMRRGLGFDRQAASDPAVMAARAAGDAWQALSALLPLFALLAGAAVLASVALGGLVVSAKPLQPDFARLNPLKGLGRMFSANALVELGKAVAKSLLVGGVAAWVIWSARGEIVGLMRAPWPGALGQAVALIVRSCALIVGSLLLVVLIDAPWQIWSHLKKLRMSREDVRQEHKESEGDPHVKGRIRQQQRSMARRRMMAAVPGADVVVTNPSHYAVALRYREQGMAAPVLVAKGSGLIAARIRQLAETHRVPVLEAPPLARALHRHVEIGQEIPAALYTAVAEVLAWVFQLRAWRAGQGREPRRPADLPVPAPWDPRPAGAGEAR